MVFPKNDYITFSLSKTITASFTFPNKKPKRLWLDTGGEDIGFRIKVNDDTTGLLIHMSRNLPVSITIPSTVDSLFFESSSENEYFLSLLVEEWGN